MEQILQRVPIHVAATLDCLSAGLMCRNGEINRNESFLTKRQSGGPLLDICVLGISALDVMCVGYLLAFEQGFSLEPVALFQQCGSVDQICTFDTGS